MQMRLCPVLFFSVSMAITVHVEGQDLPWDNLGRNLVERMQLESGERVLFVGQPGQFNPLVESVRRAVRSTSAEDLGVISVTGDAPASWGSAFTRGAAGLSREQLVQYLGDVDLAVMLPGASTTHAPYAAMQDILRTNRARTIHYHWAGAYDMHGNLMANTPTIDRLYAHTLLQTDYDALTAKQTEFENAMRGHVIRVTTPDGTDIQFEIGDRPVTKQDGDASASRASRARNLIDREIELPAGALRVAPLEESVNGTIVFPDASWAGRHASGVAMRIERGRVVEVSAADGGDAVEAEIGAAGDAGRAFREFALGFNPLIAVREDNGMQWIPYYGYGAGVVRLSLGDNSELGGNVTGGYVRWNFFPNATVLVGDDTWVRDGRMIR